MFRNLIVFKTYKSIFISLVPNWNVDKDIESAVSWHEKYQIFHIFYLQTYWECFAGHDTQTNTSLDRGCVFQVQWLKVSSHFKVCLVKYNLEDDPVLQISWELRFLSSCNSRSFASVLL